MEENEWRYSLPSPVSIMACHHKEVNRIYKNLFSLLSCFQNTVEESGNNSYQESFLKKLMEIDIDLGCLTSTQQGISTDIRSLMDVRDKGIEFYALKIE